MADSARLYLNITNDTYYTLGLMAWDIHTPGPHIYNVERDDMRVYDDRVRIALRSVPSDGFSTLPMELITRIASFLYNADHTLMFRSHLIYRCIKNEVYYVAASKTRDYGVHLLSTLQDVPADDIRFDEARARVALRSTPCHGFTQLPMELVHRIATFPNITEIYRLSVTSRGVCYAVIHLLLQAPRWKASSPSAWRHHLWQHGEQPSESSLQPRSLMLLLSSPSICPDITLKLRPLLNLCVLRFALCDFSLNPDIFHSITLLMNLKVLSFMNCTLPPCPSEVADRFHDLCLVEFRV